MPLIYLDSQGYEISQLPSEPALLVKLLALCRQESASFEDFTSAIGQDPALTAKVMQLCSSPYYRQWNRSKNLRTLLVMLGLTNVRNIVTASAIQQFFANFTPAFDASVQQIWKRALICAHLGERLATLTAYPNPSEAYLAGLLHQVGQLLLLLNHRDSYQPLLQECTRGEDLCTRERELLQVDHCQLGAALIDGWQMDSFLSEAIRFQHAPVAELASAPKLLRLLAVASPLAAAEPAGDIQRELGRGGELFNLTEELLLDTLALAREKSEEMLTLFRAPRPAGDAKAPPAPREQLAAAVRDLSLGRALQPTGDADLSGFCRSLQSSCAILFNLHRLLFLSYSEADNALRPVTGRDDSPLDGLRIAVGEPGHLLGRVLSERTPGDSAAAPCSIADRQILRYLDSPTFYALPVYAQLRPLGVLVVGVGQGDLERLQQETPLLQLLLEQLAGHCRPEEENSNLQSVPLNELKQLSHEISNPLTIIKNYLYVLGKKLEAKHPAQEELGFISTEIDRVGSLLLRLKDPQKANRQKDRLEVNTLIRELDSLLRASLYSTRKIETDLQLDDSIPPLRGSSDKLRQVLINLLKNAAEALPPGGRISISSRDQVRQSQRNDIEICIRDNGPGIPLPLLQQLFTPVKSSKPGHSGLGLCIVAQLVEELGGMISCHSLQQQGTEFRLLLPRRLADAEESAP